MYTLLKNLPKFAKNDYIPFCDGDVTAGCENEFQTVVIGDKSSVDLPLTIESSNYISNIKKRVLSGEIDKKDFTQLERFINDNPDGVWENSWVRFPLHTLSLTTIDTLKKDLLRDKKDPNSPLRSDHSNFFINYRNETWIRIPVSYLLKLSLLDAVSSQENIPNSIIKFAYDKLNNFLNDNISPEVNSFVVVEGKNHAKVAEALTRETSLRFLLIQLLTKYAEKKFKLEENNQKVLVYFSPLPPIRIRSLNEIISDSFYMELFINPCLSGWDRGEEKYQYMLRCHQALSRSQLNCIKKLKDAGILKNNLVVMPNTSNISLANNGTHISIGSKIIAETLKKHDYYERYEKYYGDLVIKFFEHFLPLFSGSFSASPYRLDFTDFHPERVLGFLPHELDYTHLRMLWRRWKTKADLKIFNKTITPFGPTYLDKFISKVLNLRGDYVPDYRCIDYLVAILSTNTTPALDGTLGNLDRLKKDLERMGIFDAKMSPYLLYRLREYFKVGFSGFEGRFYSLFSNLTSDMTSAIRLQILITHIAYALINKNQLMHHQIPDDPTTESERRQIFFASAIDIPTVYIRKDTPNTILKKIISCAENTRISKRYPGYIRVPLFEYKKALLKYLNDMLKNLNLDSNYTDLISETFDRIHTKNSKNVANKITSQILKLLKKKDPIHIDSQLFNKTLEEYYRNDLRISYIKEAISILKEEITNLKKDDLKDLIDNNETIFNSINKIDLLIEDLMKNEIDVKVLVQLINIILVVFIMIQKKNSSIEENERLYDSSVHRAGNW